MRPVAGKSRVRREDARVKAPALLHLVRMGYRYLPREEIQRDPETCILPSALRDAVARINGAELAEESFARLMADLRTLLAMEDLGQGFYTVLRDGWNGLRLLDFARPERNCFQVGTEIPCARGRKRFRPDITVFVNGLPLAMMEVKAPEQRDGILAEYDRMCRRFREGAFRRFLQAAQLWLFSNDQSVDTAALTPRDGAYYTTAAAETFSIYPGPGRADRGLYRGPALDRKTEARVLADLGLEEIRKDPAYRRWKAADTPTNRMLTALLRPERFLFLLRFGIRYVEDPADGVRKRILTWEQLDALSRVEKKQARGFLNWRIPCTRPAERCFLGAAAAAVLRERMPDCRLIWVVESRAEKRRAEAAFRGQGLQEGEMTLLAAEEIRRDMYAAPEERAFTGRRVFFLSEPAQQYRPTRGQPAGRLRAADPRAILITMGAEALHEGENYTYLLQCADGTLYCGWTNDLENRVRTHNAGRGARYTRSRLPVRLVYWERFETKEEAMRREWRIKRLSRAEKEELIRKAGMELNPGARREKGRKA